MGAIMKADPVSIEGKSKTVPISLLRSGDPPTIEKFWLQMGWYERKGDQARLKNGEWKNWRTRNAAIRFLALDVLRKDPRKLIFRQEFHVL